MDSFWTGIEPHLRQVVEEVIPEPALSKIITQYSGPETKDDHLREIASHLSSRISDRSSHGQDIKPSAWALAEVYTELKDSVGRVRAWSSIVEVDDRETSNDHPTRDLAAMFNLGAALNDTGRSPEAEVIYKRLLPMLAAVPKLGRNSQQYIGGVTQLMMALGNQGRREEMLEYYEEQKPLIAQLDDGPMQAHGNAAERVVRETGLRIGS